MLLSEITYNPELPVPIGILYQETKSTYDEMMTNQIQDAKKSTGSGDLEKLFSQLFGKEGGYTKGRDRTFHFGDKLKQP